MYSKFDQLAKVLLSACSEYLGRDNMWLTDIAQNGNSILRVINYPPLDTNSNTNSIRAAAHEDINLITILCESTSGGLELKTHDGTWLPIAKTDGALIVDSGDMLQNITNGIFKSTTHRVVNPKDPSHQRFSMPFFSHPRPECSLTPPRDLIEKTGGVQKYSSTTAGEYLSQRLEEIGF